jgi:hypothetical protein
MGEFEVDQESLALSVDSWGRFVEDVASVHDSISGVTIATGDSATDQRATHVVAEISAALGHLHENLNADRTRLSICARSYQDVDDEVRSKIAAITGSRS